MALRRGQTVVFGVQYRTASEAEIAVVSTTVTHITVINRLLQGHASNRKSCSVHSPDSKPLPFSTSVVSN